MSMLINSRNVFRNKSSCRNRRSPSTLTNQKPHSFRGISFQQWTVRVTRFRVYQKPKEKNCCRLFFLGKFYRVCFFFFFFSITDYYVIYIYRFIALRFGDSISAKEYRYTLVRTRDTRRSHWLIAFIEHTVPFYDFISPMLIPVYRCTFTNTIRIEYYNNK